MTINELFTKVTTSRIDVEAMIEQTKNSEDIDNKDVFRHIMWHIPAGVRYTSDEEMSTAINSLINDAAKELDVDKEEIFNEDGLITDTEKIALSSKVEIETKPEEPIIKLSVWDGLSFEEPEQDEDCIYLIKTAANLAWLSKKITAGNSVGTVYRLEADIDLDNKDWTPIGKTTGRIADDPNPIFFRGIFDGNGHEIKNLKTNVDDDFAKSGLFGALQGAIIKNLTVRNASIKSTHYAGVIAAYNAIEKCVIENCKVYDSEIVTNTRIDETEDVGEWNNGDKAGGIIGYVSTDESLISGCLVENVNIRGYRDLGGIVGFVDARKKEITISNCEVNDLTITQDLEHNYKNYTEETAKQRCGKYCGYFEGNAPVDVEENVINVNIINLKTEENGQEEGPVTDTE